MNGALQPDGLGVLYAEHLALGATFDDAGLISGYAEVSDTEHANVLLADVSSAHTTLFGGKCAEEFSHAAFSGEKLHVGACAYEAVLTGDGRIASIPLLARTGTSEYICVDTSPRFEILYAWLSFLKSVESDGYAPFGQIELEDVTSSHVVLALWGPKATEVLLDYASSQSLPRRGKVCSCLLDSIPCIVVRLDLPQGDCFLVYVPPQRAVALWRSLLSFVEVVPVGLSLFREHVACSVPALAQLNTADAVSLPAQALRDQGIMRNVNDFVGSRGVATSAKGERD